jgi:hypothetical protein
VPWLTRRFRVPGFQGSKFKRLRPPSLCWSLNFGTLEPWNPGTSGGNKKEEARNLLSGDAQALGARKLSPAEDVSRYQCLRGTLELWNLGTLEPWNLEVLKP